MPISLQRFVQWLRHLALALAAAWPGLSPALATPAAEGWNDRGDAAFHKAIGSSMIVNVMAQDRRGFLWLGAQAGLARWDGYKLRTFLGDMAGTGTLLDSFVMSLLVDSRGRLWVGTSAGGIARYDETGERFDLPVPVDALSRRSVFSIAQDRDGTLLLGTGGGLDRLDPDRRVVQRHADWAAALGLPAAGVYAVLVDSTGTVWAGTERGVYKRSGSGAFVNVPLRGLEPGQGVVSCMLQDADGRIWVGTRAHGAFVVEPGAAQALALQARAHALPPGLAPAIVHSLAEARPGEVWVGTGGQGIFRVDTHGWRVRRTHHIDNVAGSLMNDEVFALFRDRQGRVWAATDVGMSFHDAQQTGIVTWFGGDEEGRKHGGLSTPNIPFVLPMPDGTAWLSTGDGGIDIVSPAGGRIHALRPNPASPVRALPGGRVLGMALSPSGQEVYAGTRGGLYRIDIASFEVQRLTLPNRAPTADVWALAWQGERLWIGGIDGLWGTKPGPGATMEVLARDDGAGLGEQRVTALLPDPDGSLWVGTRSGLVRVDPATMRVQRLSQDAPGRIGLPGGYTASIVKDAAGRIWVAGYGSGIRVFQPTPDGVKGLRRVSTAEGLPTNAVNALAMDKQGDVWASTDMGVARISRDTLQVDAIGSADGLGMQVYWANSAGVTAGGLVLFGGNGGLTVIDPRRAVRAPAEPPPLVVTEVRLADGLPLTAYDPGAGLPPLQLRSDSRSLLVEFAGLYYAAPEAVRYEYRLRGTDRQWVSADASHRFAAYTNLPPGDHVLELRAAAPKGPWSEPLLLPLHVQPAWHETAWARIALALAGGGALLLAMQARTVVLRRRERTLKALVAERTHQLEDSQRQLEQIAYFDGLSGLANRRLFNDELKRMVAASERSGRCAALVLVDLDHFKQFNDTLGHDAGDAILVAVAQRLTSAMRETDRVARLGGDEFAILLPEVDGPAAVQRVCERVFAALAPPVVYEGSSLQAGASVGAALCPRDAHTPEALYKAADIALYEAKRAGRNGWRMAAPPDGGAAVTSA
jgi:diguanylate cyclase (GGDEF)-like protein